MERLTHLPDVPGETLEPLFRSLQHCMHDLRQIIEEAKPSVLQLFGVAEAIENHLDRSVRESGAPIVRHVVDDSCGRLETLEQTVATALFRIVQEAINNAVRHGQPSEITVCLRDEGTGLTVTVTDNGVGIGSPREQAGHGIDNMRTRSRLIGARFEIGGSAAGGTCVKLMLPHNASRHQE
ncbi:MAG: sensor histidine kinase, partial [Pseudorhizobium sp.]